MGHDRHGRGGARRAGQDGDDVLDVAALDIDLAVAGLGLKGVTGLNTDLEAQAGEAADDIVAHPVVIGRSHRMGPGGDGLDIGEGALA